jgi:outer membrane protein assembly factor BamB
MRGVALGLGLIVVLAAAAGVVARDGRRQEPPAFRCGRRPVAALEVFNADGSRRWRQMLPARVTESQTSPLADEARVYTSEGGLAAFDIQTGGPVWSLPIKGPVYSEWLDGNQLIAVAEPIGGQGTILGVNAASGRVRWNYQIPEGHLLGEGMRTGDGGLALLSPDGAVRVLDMADGRIRWAIPPVGPENPEAPVAMAAGDGLVVVAHAGTMTGLNAGDGTVRWRTQVAVRSFPRLAGAAIVLFDTTVDQKLAVMGYGLDDGQRRWQTPPTPFTEVPSTIEPLVILSHGYPDRMLQAVDPATGAVRWQSDLGPSLIREAATGPTDLVTMQATVDVKDTRLVVRHLNDGTVSSDTPLPHGYLDNMIATPDGGYYGVLSSLVIGDLSQQITAFRQGRLTWTVRLVSQVQRPPAILPSGGIAVQEADPECIPNAQRAGTAAGDIGRSPG